jgi:hypothetical protein
MYCFSVTYGILFATACKLQLQNRFFLSLGQKKEQPRQNVVALGNFHGVNF